MLRTKSSCRPTVRGGKIIVLVALSLVGVLGMVALTTDGGLLLDQRRRVQTAADAAALAAAEDLFKNYQTYQGVDTPGTAEKLARSTAAAHGYTDDKLVTVNIPPKNGDHVGAAGYVEVIIESRQSRTFSSIFGGGDLPVKARAVARGRWIPFRDGILVLDLTATESLKANGTGTIYINGADLIVNSNDTSAVGGDGSGTTIQVDNGNFVLRGGVKSNTTLIGTVQQQSVPTPDPLAYLPEPKLSDSTLTTAKGLQPNSPIAQPYLQALGLKAKDVNGKVYVLDPGRYDNLPNFGNGDVVILKQGAGNNGIANNGIYYLNGCGFHSSGATVVVDPTGATTGGVMFYNDPLGKTSAD